MASPLRFLIIGDLIGNPGLAMFQKWALKLKQQYKADSIIVNGENVAKDGRGVSAKSIDVLKSYGADVITTGNHIWDNKEVFQPLQDRDDLIRPANYPSGSQGKGYALYTIGNQTVAVVNFLGRVFSREPLDCPFRSAESLVLMLKHKTKIIIVDFHAEATSEKNAMGLFLDGKVSCVVGTHTHIQTADQRILPQGTGFITDLGSSGALNSAIGFCFDGVIKRFMYHHKMGKFVVETTPPYVMSGIVVDIDPATGKATNIEPIRVIDETLSVPPAT